MGVERRDWYGNPNRGQDNIVIEHGNIEHGDGDGRDSGDGLGISYP